MRIWMKDILEQDMHEVVVLKPEETDLQEIARFIYGRSQEIFAFYHPGLHGWLPPEERISLLPLLAKDEVWMVPLGRQSSCEQPLEINIQTGGDSGQAVS